MCLKGTFWAGSKVAGTKLFTIPLQVKRLFIRYPNIPSVSLWLTLLQQEPTLLIDLRPLYPLPKIIPPETKQLPNESRRFWHNVTAAILDKQFGQATKLKQELEERQREKAAERKERNLEWKPRFFTGSVTPAGKPDLTAEGKLALQRLYEGDFHLEESVVTGA